MLGKQTSPIFRCLKHDQSRFLLHAACPLRVRQGSVHWSPSGVPSAPLNLNVARDLGGSHAGC